jgi:membrane protein
MASPVEKTVTSLAVSLTIAVAFFILVALTLILIGPALASRIAVWFGLAPAAALLWQLMRWPVMALCVVIGVDLVHHFARNRKTGWVWITRGALLATALWIASSFGFKVYVAKGRLNNKYSSSAVFLSFSRIAWTV